METTQKIKDWLLIAVEYVKKNWWQLSLFGLLLVSCAVGILYPPLRLRLEEMLTRREIIKETSTQTNVAEDVAERIQNLESSVDALTKEKEQDRVQRLQLVEQFQKAQTEVAKTNDNLLAQTKKVSELYGQLAAKNSTQNVATASESSTAPLKDGLVHINTANVSDLDTLPGIGPSTAAKIIAYRNEHGNFTSLEDIKNVAGIGDATYLKFKDLIAL